MGQFPCWKIRQQTVCVCVRNAHSIFHLCVRQKWATYAYRTNLWMPATISWRLVAHFHTRKHAAAAYVGLRHACMHVSAGLSDAYTTLSLWCACFRVVKAGEILVPDPATGHCGQCYDPNRYAHILIQALMHANSDTETSHASVCWWHPFYFDERHLYTIVAN